MKGIEKSKMIYDNMEIPSELDRIVKSAIAAAEEKRKDEKNDAVLKEITEEKKHKEKRENKKTFTFVRRGLTAAAAFIMAFTVGLNSSEAFAVEMEAHPLLGGLARILTVRSYHGFDEERGIQKDVEVPMIEIEEAADQSNSVADTVNTRIQLIIDSHLAQAEADFQQYKETFTANGGTAEEWEGRTMELDVDYEVKYQKEDFISLVIYYSEVSAFAYEKSYYYNINLAENKEMTLEDVLGEAYVSIANEQILSQMRERMKEDEDIYYWGIEGEEEDGITGFTTVDKTTTFYIKENGNPVVAFEEYEVAPGYMGIQEFEIQR